MRRIRKVIKTLISRFKKIVPVFIPVYKQELLKGRVALITGGTQGIGYSIAKAFIDSGANVIITGRNKEKIDAACSSLKAKKPEALILGFVLDNTDSETFSYTFENIIFELKGKKVDILVNNAGVNSFSTFPKTTVDEFDLIYDTNLKGTYFISQLIANYMIKNNNKGNILNVSSSSGLRPGNSPYILSKWGLNSLTLGMAKTLLPFDIVVNSIAPGPTKTPMMSDHSYNGIESKTSPSGRLTTPDEVSNLAVILVSKLGRMIVGDTIYMTGGAGLLTFDDIKYGI